MGSRSPREQRTTTTQSLTRVPTTALYKTLNRISRPAPTATQRVTEGQRKLVLTSFILGGFSILTSFFPICGLPIAIAGLSMGISGYRVPALKTLASWGIVLSTIGLVLTLIFIVFSLGRYFGPYLLG